MNLSYYRSAKEQVDSRRMEEENSRLEAPSLRPMPDDL